DAVNIASRIEPLAPPGGVSVSEQVFTQIKNKVEFPLVNNGTTHLKNIEEPVAVYRVVFPWERNQEQREETISPSEPDKQP
ncbi:MAG: adenylate cyclase, partial [Nitrososphaerales archaeon]